MLMFDKQTNRHRGKIQFKNFTLFDGHTSARARVSCSKYVVGLYIKIYSRPRLIGRHINIPIYIRSSKTWSINASKLTLGGQIFKQTCFANYNRNKLPD